MARARGKRAIIRPQLRDAEARALLATLVQALQSFGLLPTPPS